MSRTYRRTTCRACLSPRLIPILSLGKQPLANEFLKKSDLGRREKTFPLTIVRCPKCSMVQLSDVVDPAVLFADYHYLTSASAPLVAHFTALAKKIRAHIRSRKDLVVEIGSNDGTLLQALRGSCRVLGVDPAGNIARRAQHKGIRTIVDFFSAQRAKKIRAREGAAQVIVANNVMAHIDDLDDVLSGVRTLLADDGVFIFEVHWVGNLIGKGGFDQIYHEHLSYFSLHAVQALSARFGFVITDVELVPIHGESLRIFLKKSGSSQRVRWLLARERALGITRSASYRAFARSVARVKKDLRALVADLKRQKKTIVGYGAPAKGNTLLNYVGFTARHLDFITDTTPLKWNHYTPGSHIRILSPETLRRHPPDYALLLSWNYAPQILAKEKVLRARGTKFIIPVPKVRIQ